MTEVFDLIQNMGIQRIYQGTIALEIAVRFMYQDDSYARALTTRLYPDVAKELETTSSRVERNLRTIIGICWNRGNREVLEKIAMQHLYDKPTAGEFIRIVINYLRRQGVALSN